MTMASEEGKQGSSLILKVVLALLLVLAMLDLGVAVFMRSAPFVMPRASVDAVRGGVSIVANMVGLGGLLGLDPEVDGTKPAKTKAELFYAEGRNTEAIEEWKRELAALKGADGKGGIGPGAAEIHNSLGRAYRHLEDYKQAREQHMAAIKAYPSGGRGYYGLGLVDHNEKDFRKAQENYKKAIELNYRRDYVYFNLGQTHILHDEFESGVEAFKKVVELNPSYEGAHRQAGRSYESMGMLKEAEQEYRREAALGNQLAGLSELEAMGIRSRLATNGEGPGAEALLTLGKGYRDLNRGFIDSHKALDAFYRLLVLEPSRAGVHMQIGEIYESMGLNEYAAREYRAELKIEAASSPSATSTPPSTSGASASLKRVSLGEARALPPVRYSMYKASSLARVLGVTFDHVKKHEDASGAAMYVQKYRIRLALPSFPEPIRSRTYSVISLYNRSLRKKNPEQTMELGSGGIGMYSHELRLTHEGKDVVLVFWSPALSRIMRETWPKAEAVPEETTEAGAGAEEATETGAMTGEAAKAGDTAETVEEIRPAAEATLDLYVTLGIFDDFTETTYLFVDGFNYDDNHPDFVL